jgi:hypothetical protein
MVPGLTFNTFSVVSRQEGIFVLLYKNSSVALQKVEWRASPSETARSWAIGVPRA